jgi:CubicO group peptidase (beta-lactamase class C family)
VIRWTLALLMLSGSAAAQDSIFAPLAGGKSPGLAVLIRKDGRTVFARGYGVRDLRTLRKIDAAALRASGGGSLSQTFKLIPSRNAFRYSCTSSLWRRPQCRAAL